MRLRADAGVFVQASEADRHERRVVGTDGMRVAAAIDAERLAPAVAWIPDAHLVLASRHRECAGRAKRGHRARRTGTALTALAVAVERADERRGRGNLHSATHAPPGEWGEVIGPAGHRPRDLPCSVSQCARRATSDAALESLA